MAFLLITESEYFAKIKNNNHSTRMPIHDLQNVMCGRGQHLQENGTGGTPLASFLKARED
jgi:hypothetical protein